MDITILYATVTGNSEDVANKIQTAFSDAGNNANVENLADLNVNNISQYKNIVLVTSTWGDGEPPMDAQDFYDNFMDSQLDLSNTKYAIFGLGESIYEQFCQTAIDFDNAFNKYGATRAIDLIKADGDPAKALSSWLPEAISAFK